jgi:hypothetical protein
LKFFCNLPKRVNCGNIAMLGGSGKMESHLLKKIAQKFSQRLKTPHLYFVVLHDIMVGITLLVSVLSCMQLVYLPNKEGEDS